jgi:predicted short-subunit dehydrogenase-like oxidoreductase (DUF2520 family)
MTSIIIVGSGNVASSFCKLIQRSNLLLLKAIVARNEVEGNTLATTNGTSYFNITTNKLPEADVAIIAVSDSNIEEAAAINFDGQTILTHTAGAVSIQVLLPFAKQYGVLYPLQSLNKNDQEINDIPILYDGSDEITTQRLAIIAKELSQASFQVNDEDRSKYHLSAVFVNNFGNYLFTLAYDYCKKNGLNFSLLLPLIKATAQKISNNSPQALQTGPAIRKDTTTIEKHKELLQEEEEMKKIYDLFTSSINGREK